MRPLALQVRQSADVVRMGMGEEDVFDFFHINAQRFDLPDDHFGRWPRAALNDHANLS